MAPSNAETAEAISGDWFGFGVAPREPACAATRSAAGANRQHPDSSVGIEAASLRLGEQYEQGVEAGALSRGMAHAATFAAGTAVQGTPMSAMRRNVKNRFTNEPPSLPIEAVEIIASLSTTPPREFCAAARARINPYSSAGAPASFIGYRSNFDNRLSFKAFPPV